MLLLREYFQEFIQEYFPGVLPEAPVLFSSGAITEILLGVPSDIPREV